MITAELRTAALLAEAPPAAGVAPAEDGVDPSGVVQILRANKVPLVEVAARSGPSSPITSSAVWRAALAGEEREKEHLAAEFEQVAARFGQQGIRPVLFKSAGGLPYRASNLDLLVRPSDMAGATRILEDLGHLRLPHYREDHKLLFRKFHHGRSVICIHLHEAVSWGRILILPAEDVLKRSRPGPDAGFRIASVEDLLLLTLAHSLYETDQIRLSDLRTVGMCSTDPGFDWEKALLLGLTWTTGLCSMLVIVSALETSLYGRSRIPMPIRERAQERLEAARWAGRYVESVVKRLTMSPPARMPYQVSRAYSKLHYVARLLGEPTRSPDEKMEDLLATAWSLLANRLRLRCRPAVLVSLTGIDGSGKSTAIGSLREAMVLCEIPTRQVWSRGGFTFWMQAAKRAARSALPDTMPGPDEVEAKQRWLSHPLAGTLFAAIVTIEQSVHYLLRVRAPRWAGFSILCDRYVYDAAADLQSKLGRGRFAARAASLLVSAAAPAPDLAILLRISPEAASCRKPGDAPLIRLVDQSAILDRLAGLHGMLVIDADRPDEEVIGEVVDRALRVVLDRFGGARP